MDENRTRELNVVKKRSVRSVLVTWEMILVYILIGINLVGICLKPRLFLSASVVSMMIQSGMDKAVLSLGMYTLLGQGDRDMSCGGLVLLLSMVMGLLYGAGIPFVICFIIVLVVAVIAEIFSAYLVEKLRFDPVIVGIALGLFYRGIGKIVMNDRSITTFPGWFINISWDKTLGGWVPLSFIAFLLIGAIFYIVMHKTKLGRQFELVGNNREAARYSGINVGKLRYIGYVIFGVMVAVSTIFFVGRLSNGISCTSGEGYEFQVMVIATLGTITINNRRPTVLGLVVSSLIICSFNYVLGLLGLDAQTRQMVIGLLMIGSVAISKLNKGMIDAMIRKIFYGGSFALQEEVAEYRARREEIREELRAGKLSAEVERKLRGEMDELKTKEKEAIRRHREMAKGKTVAG